MLLLPRLPGPAKALPGKQAGSVGFDVPPYTAVHSTLVVQVVLLGGCPCLVVRAPFMTRFLRASLIVHWSRMHEYEVRRGA